MALLVIGGGALLIAIVLWFDNAQGGLTGNGVFKSLELKPWVTAPILGATNVEQVDEAVEALDVRLGADDVKRLEELYTPHVIHSAVRPPE